MPQIAFRRAGRGPTVLMIHGVGGESSNWDPIAKQLREHFDVIAMDLRGHGGSELLTQPVDAHDLARDVLQVLDEANVETCAVVGFSLGGIVAQAFTLDYPHRVSHLAVIGTPCARTPEEQMKAQSRISLIEEQGLEGIVESNRERWFTDAFRRDHANIVERRVAQVKACDERSYLHAFRVFATADFADRLNEIQSPTLVITGEEDLAASGRMARFMGEHVPCCEVHVLQGLRHSLLIEATNTVTDLLERFLSLGDRPLHPERAESFSSNVSSM